MGGTVPTSPYIPEALLWVKHHFVAVLTLQLCVNSPSHRCDKFRLDWTKDL